MASAATWTTFLMHPALLTFDNMFYSRRTYLSSDGESKNLHSRPISRKTSMQQRQTWPLLCYSKAYARSPTTFGGYYCLLSSPQNWWYLEVIVSSEDLFIQNFFILFHGSNRIKWLSKPRCSFLISASRYQQTLAPSKIQHFFGINVDQEREWVGKEKALGSEQFVVLEQAAATLAIRTAILTLSMQTSVLGERLGRISRRGHARLSQRVTIHGFVRNFWEIFK